MTELTLPTDRVRVFHGDSREVLKTLPDNSLDSCCCDPPYALTSIVKRFGSEDAAPAQSGKSGAYARASAGFMGQKWDTGEVAFDPDFWAEVMRVLKPGGHILAFGGSRTYGELQVAIQAAGFEVRDSILELVSADAAIIPFLQSLTDEQFRAFMRAIEESQFGGLLAWVYGSGFPKSHDVSKAIDKAAGAKREVVGAATYAGRNGAAGGNAVLGSQTHRQVETTPATPEAAEWEGWGTALKPAFEPIVMARKPLIGTVAANVLAHGTGAINIDGCRIGSADAAGGERDGEASTSRRYADRGATNFAPTPGPRGGDAKGRFPANVIHDGSAEVVSIFPSEAGASAPVRGTEPSSVTSGIYGKFSGRTEGAFYSDNGSASRFFYSAKADGEDRVSRCSVCSTRWIGRRPCACRDAVTGELARAVGHPTVKPVDGMAWLCRLVTPPGGVVLDCFAGSGTTGMACLREGFRAILIEREAEYVGDIMHRLRHVIGDDAPLFEARS